MTATRRLVVRLVVLSGLLAGASPSLAQSVPSPVAQMSIEDLMGIEITSASRREQRVEDVAAAVFVISHDDIRRSGMTTIPDLLRLAPGVQVAHINASKWAIGDNLFDAAQPAFSGTASLLQRTELRRSVSLRWRWALR
jgi:iron complex outermembrane receptor protein